MTNAERIKEIEDRAAKATPAPWAQVVHYDFDGNVELITIIPAGAPGGIASVAVDSQTDEDNAALIANAPSDLAFLLSTLHAVEADNKARTVAEQSLARLTSEYEQLKQATEGDPDSAIALIGELSARATAAEANNARLRAALEEKTRVRPTKICPNCGHWYAMGECRHSSSGQSGTLYGVCKSCADKYAEFSALQDLRP